MPTLPKDGLRQAQTDIWQGRPHLFGLERLYGVMGQHEDGDLSDSGILGRLILRDDRISACLDTRVNALLGCQQDLCGAEIDDDTEEEDARDAAREWWPKVVTESALRAVASDLQTYGVGFAEVIYETTAKTWTPVELRHWDVDHFRWDHQRETWIVHARDGQQDVAHGDGRWVIFGSGAKPWRNGFVLSLSDKWFFRQCDWRDWARFTEKLGQGVFKAKTPTGSSEPDKARFASEIQRIGTNAVIRLPQGKDPGSSYDLELLAAPGTGYQNFETAIAAVNVAIAVRILGQNLTTEAQGGSYAAANVQDRVRGDLLQLDAETESTTLHTGLLMPWALANYGDASLAPWPKRATEPLEDEKAEAETKDIGVRALTVAAALSPLVDVEHELEEIGYELLDPKDVPEPPPAPVPPPIAAPDNAPADPPEEALSMGRGPLVRLAGGNPSRFLHAGQTWANGLVGAATELSAPEVSRVILSIKRAAKESSGFEDFRMRLIDLASEAPSKASEEMFERAILLAVGQGTYSASLEIDAGP